MQHDTPDELFNCFSILAVSSPVDAKIWSVQLCSRYLASLSKDLAKHVTAEDYNFVMPNLVLLDTKACQLDVIQEIHEHTASSYKV